MRYFIIIGFLLALIPVHVMAQDVAINSMSEVRAVYEQEYNQTTLTWRQNGSANSFLVNKLDRNNTWHYLGSYENQAAGRKRVVDYDPQLGDAYYISECNRESSIISVCGTASGPYLPINIRLYMPLLNGP